MGKPTPINEVINERFSKLNLNDINDETVEKRKKSAKASKTEAIASKLQREFDAPQSYDFFLKCAWHLSESDIWSAVEASKRPWIKAPVKYFVRSCHNKMLEQQ